MGHNRYSAATHHCLGCCHWSCQTAISALSYESGVTLLGRMDRELYSASETLQPENGSNLT